MNIIAVDDKRPVLLQVEGAIREAVPDCILAGFVSSKKALAYARETRVDVAFLDIDMAEMNGLILARHLKEIYGKTNIIFITGYSQYALDAFRVPASGYILKPAEPEAIIQELNRLRDPVSPGEQTGRVRITCFGNFSIFVDNKPLIITREKPKELLAYLVHKRGTFVRTSEIAAVLWEDKTYSSSVKANLRQVIFRLMNILRDVEIEDIILKKWDSMAVDVTKISCDYYDFMNKKASGINAYTGEYMNEYGWAEFTIGYLNDKLK